MRLESSAGALFFRELAELVRGEALGDDPSWALYIVSEVEGPAVVK
jgi:hypothetical protein